MGHVSKHNRITCCRFCLYLTSMTYDTLCTCVHFRGNVQLSDSCEFKSQQGPKKPPTALCIFYARAQQRNVPQTICQNDALWHSGVVSSLCGLQSLNKDVLSISFMRLINRLKPSLVVFPSLFPPCDHLPFHYFISSSEGRQPLEPRENESAELQISKRK